VSERGRAQEATLLRNNQHQKGSEMIICDFCLLRSPEGACSLGLNIPKTMKCREFAPGIERFCAKPTDFVSPNQITEMARFFGLERTELKKVKIIAERRVADEACKVS
jgi:hypothetical protein